MSIAAYTNKKTDFFLNPTLDFPQHISPNFIFFCSTFLWLMAGELLSKKMSKFFILKISLICIHQSIKSHRFFV